MCKWNIRVMRGIEVPMCIHSMDSRILQPSCLLLMILFSMLILAPTETAGRQDPNLLQFISDHRGHFSSLKCSVREVFITLWLIWQLMSLSAIFLCPFKNVRKKKKKGCPYLEYDLWVDHLKNLHLQLLGWMVKPFPEQHCWPSRLDVRKAVLILDQCSFNKTAQQ